MRYSSLAAVLIGLFTTISAIDPIEVVGSKFFNKDGSQFFLKGVSYQLLPDDPLIDTEQCKRDVELMKDLGANAIRVYHVDESADHDGCMKTFADAGIYALIDMDTFDTYITPDQRRWSQRQYERFCKVMDAFASYDNTLAFFVGNENVYQKEESFGAPFLKAAARDMKAYRKEKGYRDIPVGYSAADIKELRPMLQDYLTCGGNSSEIIDFFGINSYSWCDPSTYEHSTYNQLEEFAKDFPVPIFFTETGCIIPGPRVWEDQDAIFGEDMVNDWSGAIIYEWIQEQNNYGLISYGDPVNDPTQDDGTVYDNWIRKGTPTPRQPDFGNLKTKWASIKPTGVKKADYNPDHVSTRPCPSSTQGGWWEVDGNVVLPKIDEEIEGDFEKSVVDGKATDTATDTGTDATTHATADATTDAATSSPTATITDDSKTTGSVTASEDPSSSSSAEPTETDDGSQSVAPDLSASILAVLLSCAIAVSLVKGL